MRRIFVALFMFLFIGSVCAFERDINGSTGWSAINLNVRSGPSTSYKVIDKLSPGDSFMIISVHGGFFKISYDGKTGYVSHNYCFINLPDVLPSIKYNITNASGSIYKSSGYSINGVTGEKLYSTSLVYNERLGREEYIVPSLYSTALKIAKAEESALKDGYSLMIYDSYRPFNVSKYVANKFNSLYYSNSTVRKNVDYSYGAKTGRRYYWPKTYFISQVRYGSKISTHNVGAAIDVTLYDLEKDEEVVMPSAMHELSTASIKYYSIYASHNSSGYSGGMLNSPMARRLDRYMKDAGMGTLASEWWHFQDNTGYKRLRKATGYKGCNFQVSGIVSK